jgi:hypothetical protein
MCRYAAAAKEAAFVVRGASAFDRSVVQAIQRFGVERDGLLTLV